jgi:hypothetical protein
MLALMRAAIVVQDYAEVTHVVQSMQSSSASTLYALCVLLPWFSILSDSAAQNATPSYAGVGGRPVE